MDFADIQYSDFAAFLHHMLVYFWKGQTFLFNRYKYCIAIKPLDHFLFYFSNVPHFRN